MEQDRAEEVHEEVDPNDEEEGLGLIPSERMTLEDSVEDDDTEDEDDEYEEENNDEDDDSEEQDDDYEGEEDEELIPKSPRASSSIADGLVDDKGNKELNRAEFDVCPICFKAWTSDGDHRICCLPCGHVYGMSCIKRWLLRSQSSRKCPQCNKVCRLKDIRVLYVTRLSVIDEQSRKDKIYNKGNEMRKTEDFGDEHQWTMFQRIYMDEARRHRAEEFQLHNQMLENQHQINICRIYEREWYRQQYYEYTERIRHHMNHQQGLGYIPVAEKIDYSQLPRTIPPSPLPYPGLDPPRHWPQDGSQVRNPFDTSPYARELWHSVFHPPHETPQG